ncbi:hypothetical protein GGU10DRAFT_421211 [Lentinula aff. detonsa]|uniref:MULE transposase domain-containing protein n=1 Tax=Lentinula aff. detonsa TaxID=2804958 RepID=A0AA38L2C6_9AGAR|nr:hypothetical protein GGU10DRAFT_421211 [Lentinula aff. detonsa]
MAEIGALGQVWPSARAQICWWHQRKAIKERITKAKLSATPYDAKRGHAEFSFIDGNFYPPGRADPGEREGGREGRGRDTTMDEPIPTPTKPDPNAILFMLPPSQVPLPTFPPNTKASSCAGFIKIPPQKPSPEVDEEINSSIRRFCPIELREHVLSRIESHRHAHPFIPGFAAPTEEGIYYWAVKQMYSFCKEHDLPELWAYLWENWY